MSGRRERRKLGIRRKSITAIFGRGKEGVQNAAAPAEWPEAEEAAEKEEAPVEADGDKNAKRTLSETDGAAAEEKDGKSPKVPPPLRKFPQAQLDAPCPEPARRRLHFRATPRPGSTRSTRRRPPRPTACPPTRLTASDASRSPTPALRWTPSAAQHEFSVHKAFYCQLLSE